MSILNQTKLSKTVTGHAELVAIAVEQADLEADLGALASDDETVERFIQCSSEAMPYFSVSLLETPRRNRRQNNAVYPAVPGRVDALHQVHVREAAAAERVESDRRRRGAARNDPAAAAQGVCRDVRLLRDAREAGRKGRGNLQCAAGTEDFINQIAISTLISTFPSTGVHAPSAGGRRHERDAVVPVFPRRVSAVHAAHPGQAGPGPADLPRGRRQAEGLPLAAAVSGAGNARVSEEKQQPKKKQSFHSQMVGR